MYEYRIKKYIGAYTAAMGGVDAIVFTAGVGENQTDLREDSCKNLEYLGHQDQQGSERQGSWRGGYHLY